jgi:hypothetical protein
MGDAAQFGSSGNEPDEVQVIPRRLATSSNPVDPFDPDRTSPSHKRRKLPRKNYAWIVGGAVGACTLILAVALIERVAGPHNAAAAPAETHPVSGPVPVAPSAAPSATPVTDVPTGTLVLVRPAVPGYVWLDGKKLTGTSAVVACGPHQLKVGSFGKPRTAYIPCGAELRVWR